MKSRFEAFWSWIIGAIIFLMVSVIWQALVIIVSIIPGTWKEIKVQSDKRFNPSISAEKSALDVLEETRLEGDRHAANLRRLKYARVSIETAEQLQALNESARTQEDTEVAEIGQRRAALDGTSDAVVSLTGGSGSNDDGIVHNVSPILLSIRVI